MGCLIPLRFFILWVSATNNSNIANECFSEKSDWQACDVMGIELQSKQELHTIQQLNSLTFRAMARWLPGTEVLSSWHRLYSVYWNNTTAKTRGITRMWIPAALCKRSLKSIYASVIQAQKWHTQYAIAQGTCKSCWSSLENRYKNTLQYVRSCSYSTNLKKDLKMSCTSWQLLSLLIPHASQVRLEVVVELLFGFREMWESWCCYMRRA